MSEDIFLVVIPATALVLGVLWAGIIPLWQIPDELSHFGYVQSLGEGEGIFPDRQFSRELGVAYDLSGVDRLPFRSGARQDFAIGSALGPNERELISLPTRLRREADPFSYNHAIDYPPGYYLLGSLVYRALASNDVLTIAFGLRIFSALLTSITVLFTYLTLRLFFEEHALARAATFLIALSPMYIYMGMAVNVDVLVWLLFSIYIYLLTKALKKGLTGWLNIGLASVLGLGLWVKQTFLIGVLFYFALLIFERFTRSTAWLVLARFASLFLGVIFLMDGWLYLSGSIPTSPGRPFASFSLGAFLGHLIDNWRTYKWTLHEAFWGFFGWWDAPLSPTLYAIVGFISLIGIVGFLCYLLAGKLHRQSRTAPIFFLLLMIIFGSAMSFLNYSVLATGQGWLLQGRYFFPLMGPIFAVLLIGLTWFLSRRWKQTVVLAAIGAMVVFHTLTLFNHIIPRYYL